MIVSIFNDNYYNNQLKRLYNKISRDTNIDKCTKSSILKIIKEVRETWLDNGSLQKIKTKEYKLEELKAIKLIEDIMNDKIYIEENELDKIWQ